MSLFATEFQVSSDLTPLRFTAEVIGWLRGIRDSRILDEASERDLDGDAPRLRAPTGETLAMLRLSYPGTGFTIGFRHDLPDSENRIWRTEGVLRQLSPDSIAMLRVRGQCLAAASVASLQPPRRPHLIRAMVQQGLGGRDGSLPVQTAPHHLSDDEDGQLLASGLIEGSATRHLPVVYVSAISDNRWIAARPALDRLALDLAGVAHVVLEPRREMSFRVKDLTRGRNPYGGTIGIAVPGHGIVRRLYIGWALPDAANLLEEVKAATLDLRTDMGRQDGWDWLDLQDAALRNQRQRDRNRLSDSEINRLFDEELATRDERITELESDLAALRRQKTASATPSSPWLAALGPELYPGEFTDRLRAALSDIVARGPDQSWDSRSLALFAKAVQGLAPSAALGTLREDLHRATLDNRKVGKELPGLLQKLGFSRKSDNNHIRMEAGSDLIGVKTVTVPKAPSDHRAGENLRSDIEADLGLKRLAT